MLTNRFLRWLYAIMDHSWGIGRSPRSPVCRNTDISKRAVLNRGISFPARLRSPRNIIQPIGWVGRGDILLGDHNDCSDDPGNVHSGEIHPSSTVGHRVWWRLVAHSFCRNSASEHHNNLQTMLQIPSDPQKVSAENWWISFLHFSSFSNKTEKSLTEFVIPPIFS